MVLKEQLQTLLEDSDDEDEGGEEDTLRLHKSIALKKQINNMVELEAQVKKLTLDNETLAAKHVELEQRLRNANIQHFKTIEQVKDSKQQCDTAADESVNSYQVNTYNICVSLYIFILSTGMEYAPFLRESWLLNMLWRRILYRVYTNNSPSECFVL